MAETSKLKNIELKKVEEADLPLLLWFIKRIAEYEKLSHEVTATVDTLKDSFFGSRANAEAYIGYLAGEPVAYAIYFYNFSSFLGKKGMYLEDLFVLPEHRGKGIGKDILMFLAEKANSEGCGRFEWARRTASVMLSHHVRDEGAAGEEAGDAGAAKRPDRGALGDHRPRTGEAAARLQGRSADTGRAWTLPVLRRARGQDSPRDRRLSRAA